MFDDDMLACFCGAWALPKSAYLVPVIRFGARPGRSLDAPDAAGRARRIIRFRTREVADVVEPAHGLLIDLSALPAEVLKGLDPIPADARWKDEPVRVVVPADARDLLAPGVAPKEIATDWDRALAELAFELRRYRSDGGASITAPSPVVAPRIDAVTLDLSQLSFSYRTWEHGAGDRKGGFVAIAGTYRPGSAGDDDALAIRWRLDQFCETVEPDVLIVDLRELDYQWGDAISLYPPRFPGPESPIRFIIRPGQLESMRSELHRENIVFDEATAFDDLT